MNVYFFKKSELLDKNRLIIFTFGFLVIDST